MKLLVTKNTYKRTNCELIFSKDLKQVEAYGYNWFKYVTTDKVGNIILSEYSSQTSKSHIEDIESKLKMHGLKVALRLDFINWFSASFNKTIGVLENGGRICWGDGTGVNLKNDSIEKCIELEINLIKDHILRLIEAIRKPRTHKAKNLERKKEIKKCIYRISDLRTFKNQYLNKKLKKFKYNHQYFLGWYSTIWVDSDDIKRKNKNENIDLITKVFKDIYGKYLKVNENRVRYFFKNFTIPRAALYYDNGIGTKGIELNIDKLCKLFNLNCNFQFEKIVFYPHIRDIEASIPENVDSIEYQELLKVIKRLKITKETLNTLELDRLHTALINKANRAERGEIAPKIWPQYPVNEKLLKVESILNDKKEVIEVIKDQGRLKKESRVMKHCIGQKNMGYHSKLMQGYQALNFKGYTFFLTPELEISQTHGKHNSSTPR